MLGRRANAREKRRKYYIMNKITYEKIERHMLTYMNDGAHDEQHVYRVLYYALDISDNYDIDLDVLIASALLHDIGREAQFKDPNIDHAEIGSEMAYEYIKKLGWDEERAEHVQKCINSHRYRKNNEPESMEAKILFDADKLDATGTIGIARTLAYKGIIGEPLYTIDKNGRILDGRQEKEPSFFQEYNFKLRNVYNKFYTERAKEIANEREVISKQFYEAMLNEVTMTTENGCKKLEEIIK
jgi:uncharacterized protein